MKYPGPEAYHFPAGPSHISPCMSDHWRSIPIRQGTKRQDPEHDEKPEEEEEESENSIRAEYAEEIRNILGSVTNDL